MLRVFLWLAALPGGAKQRQTTPPSRE